MCLICMILISIPNTIRWWWWLWSHDTINSFLFFSFFEGKKYYNDKINKISTTTTTTIWSYQYQKKIVCQIWIHFFNALFRKNIDHILWNWIQNKKKRLSLISHDIFIIVDPETFIRCGSDHMVGGWWSLTKKKQIKEKGPDQNNNQSNNTL